MKYLIDRLSEGATWASIGGLVTGGAVVGLPKTPSEAAMMLLGGIIYLMGVLLPDRGSKN